MNDIKLRQDNPTFHSHTKHIDIAFHFVREKECDKSFDVMYCHTEEMMADIMMKPLSKVNFKKYVRSQRSSLTFI